MINKRKLNIEKSLRRSISQAPLLDFERLAAMPVVKMTEHDYITRQQGTNTKKSGLLRKVSATAASCLVMLTCFSTWFVQYRMPDSVIALDANQSIEIVTNKHKQVLSVKAYNEEVQQLLDDQNLDQGSLEGSVSAIVSTMIQNGYLDTNKNVIMVSIQNQNEETANNLAATLNQVIKNSATAQNVTATVLMQAVAPDDQTAALAEQYNVSTGKLTVMQEIASSDSNLTMNALANMSVTELLTISKDNLVDLTDIVQIDEDNSEVNKDTETVTPAVTAPVEEAAPPEVTAPTENLPNPEPPPADLGTPMPGDTVVVNEPSEITDTLPIAIEAPINTVEEDIVKNKQEEVQQQTPEALAENPEASQQ